MRRTRFPRHGPLPERVPIAPEKIRGLLDTLPEPSRSLVWLLVLTGLRIGELLALRWRDVDFEQGILRVRQAVYEGHFDEPKTKHSSRTVPLGAKAIEILEERKPPLANPDALLFGTRQGAPLSRRNLLNRQLKPAADRVGLRGINWHWLRHANATLHDSVGTPLGTVQALLGHCSPEINREVYLHSVPADARHAVAKLEKLLLDTNGHKWTQLPDFGKLETTVIQ